MPDSRIFDSAQDRRGEGDKTIHTANLIFNCPNAVIRRGRRCTIVDQDAIVAEEPGILHRRKNASVDIDSCKKQRLHIEVAENTVEFVIPEPAEPVFVDMDIAARGFQVIAYPRAPAAFFQNRRPPVPRRVTVTDAFAGGISGMQDSWVQIEQIRPVAPVQPDDGNTDMSKGGQKCVQALYRPSHWSDIEAALRKPAAIGAEVILHVDDDHRRPIQVDGNALRFGAEGQRSWRCNRSDKVYMMGAYAP